MALGREKSDMIPEGDVDGGLLGVAEVAEMLGVTRQAVQARVQRGSLRAHKVGGVWRVPRVAAAALVRAEREKAVSSGHVRALPAGGVPGSSPVGGEEVAELAARILRLEAAMQERDREFQVALMAHEQQLTVKDREIATLKDDRHRLRVALRALLGEDDG